MKDNQKDSIILVALFVALIILNYPFLDHISEKFFSLREEVVIDRVIDGDTIEANKTIIRLLGINTPEKGEPFYEEAKLFLESRILNKTVQLEFIGERYDKYNRTLAYIFLDNVNINAEIVKNGFANYYFPSGRHFRYEEFKKAWDYCIKKNINLCKSSEDICALCVEIKELNLKEDTLTLHNKCNFSCNLKDWKIKNEGRKKFIFKEFLLNSNKDVTIRRGEGFDNASLLYWHEKNKIWASSGDSLFLIDNKGGIVLFRSTPSF